MSNAEGENPDLDPLDLPGDEPVEAEASAEPTDTGAEDLAREPAGGEEPTTEESVGEGEEPTAEEGGEEVEEAAPEEGEEGEEEKKQKLAGRVLEAIAKTDSYTVMLGISLLAIVIAIFCLLMELAAYDNDIKAEGARQPAMAWPADQFGPASTTAAAWPIDVKLTDKAEDAEPRSGWPWMT